jgi:hypothetical protein
MGAKEITLIKVGKHSVSITGLKEAVSKLAVDSTRLTDDEIGTAMMSALEKDNYLPASAAREYREAFVREFRKSLGLPYTEPASEGLDIKVLGGGCNQCSDLKQLVMETLTELNSAASLDHVMDMREIAGYHVLGVPALVINGKVVWAGSVPSKSKIRAWILDASSVVPK